MTANGANPLRWDCSARGCYNLKHRPKIEVFADDLPGRLAFSDVDAVTEVGGRFLFQEWKSGEPRDLPTGQRILYQRLTELSEKIVVVLICGDAESMEVRHVATVSRGRVSNWQSCDLAGLRARIARWSGAVSRKAA